MNKIYDITRTISHNIAVWPGDSPFLAKQVVSKENGGAVNLTTLTISPHTGTHADARWHYQNDGPTIGEMDLTPYVGPVTVITIERQTGGIMPEDLTAAGLPLPVERLLIHTRVSNLPSSQWPEDFPYPTVELIDWLSEQGCKLLGVDSPSMDPQNSKTLDGHHRLAHHNMVNLESVYLKNVPDGQYELIALPLKIHGACGSPVRAILRTLDE